MSVLDRFRLDGQRLFITGGSRGLGREMALAIADVGADVVLVGRDRDSLEKTAADIRQLGRTANILPGDVGVPAECERVCQEALNEFGPFDILINNVGGRRINVPVEEQTLEQWQQILDINLTSTFLCTKLIGGAMVKRAAAVESSTLRRSPAWSPIAGLADAATRPQRRRSFNSREHSRLIGLRTESPSTRFARADS